MLKRGGENVVNTSNKKNMPTRPSKYKYRIVC